MRKETNTLSLSPKGFQSPKFSDSDFREVRGLGLRRPKSSATYYSNHTLEDLKSMILNHDFKSNFA
jgi:hypothetical protein